MEGASGCASRCPRALLLSEEQVERLRAVHERATGLSSEEGGKLLPEDTGIGVLANIEAGYMDLDRLLAMLQALMQLRASIEAARRARPEPLRGGRERRGANSWRPSKTIEINAEVRKAEQAMEALRQQQIARLTELDGIVLAALQSMNELRPQLIGYFHELGEEYSRSESFTFTLLSQLQEVIGNVLAYVRVRPLPGAAPTITVYDHRSMSIVSSDGEPREFEFDGCFDQDATQSMVYSGLEHMARKLLEGKNVTIMAYGQTGSGKSYTMFGPRTNPGVDYRVLESLFQEVQGNSRTAYALSGSMFEIYNNDVVDLLVLPLHPIELRFGADGELKTLTRKPLASFQDALKLYRAGSERRTTQGTGQNASSSRSHCIFQIRWHWNYEKRPPPNYKPAPVLTLVDLAGSERVAKALVEGNRMKESCNINKSLSALGDVMEALQRQTEARRRCDQAASASAAPPKAARKVFIPYRNSHLTMALKSALSSRSLVSMIFTVIPGMEACEESLSTLSFAARARAIAFGSGQAKISLRVQSKRHQKLESEVTKLRAEASKEEKEVAIRGKAFEELQVEVETLRRDSESTNAAIEERVAALRALREESRQLNLRLRQNDWRVAQGSVLRTQKGVRAFQAALGSPDLALSARRRQPSEPRDASPTLEPNPEPWRRPSFGTPALNQGYRKAGDGPKRVSNAADASRIARPPPRRTPPPPSSKWQKSRAWAAMAIPPNAYRPAAHGPLHETYRPTARAQLQSVTGRAVQMQMSSRQSSTRAKAPPGYRY